MAAAVEIAHLEPQPTAAVRFTSRVEDIPRHMGAAFARVVEALAAAGAQPAGAPFAAYPAPEPDEGGAWDVVAGFPVAAPIEAAGDVVPYELPGGDVAVATHVGPYDTISRTYRELQAWMAAQGIAPAGPMWERYLTDPDREPDPSRWRTAVHVPVRPAG